MAKKKIGYWMKEGKAKRINIVKIGEILADKYGLDLIELDGHEKTIPLVDVIFHKMSDLIFEARCGKEASVQMLDRFNNYFNAHKNVKIFDPLPNVEVLLDRVSMLDAVQKCSNSCSVDNRFYSSGYLLVQDVAGVARALADKSFRFPLICKSRIAQGVQGHNMCIILNAAGLEEVKCSNVIVPFIDHDAVLYKVFVCGDKFNVVTRPSITLEKLKLERRKSDINAYNFHSDTVSKCSTTTSRVQQDLCSLETYSDRPLSDHFMPCILEWVKIIRAGLNLSLFGFDLLFESGTKKPYVIDINYFPGYDGFEDFHDILSDMLYKASI